MVDQINLNTVMMLNSELLTIESAIEIFNHHSGRITSMTVASGMNLMPALQTTVETSNMPYPQQMVETIKQYLGNREQEIRKELAGLGVTGVAESVQR